MSQSYEYTGTVENVGEVQTFESGFTKRQIVLCDKGANGFDDRVAFTFKKAHANELDGINPGDKVTIRFSIESREYNGKYFTDIVGFAINMSGANIARSVARCDAPKYTADLHSALKSYLDNGGIKSDFALFCERVTGKKPERPGTPDYWAKVIAEAAKPKSEPEPAVGDDDDLPF